jgi:hypothetical protein
MAGLAVFFLRANSLKLDRRGMRALAFFFWFSVIVPLFVENFYYSLGQRYDGIIGTWVISSVLFSAVYILLHVDLEKKISWKELGWLLFSAIIVGIGTFSSMLSVILVTR